MWAAVVRVLWILEAGSGEEGGVVRLAVRASFWRAFRRVTRRSRRTDGGGMLVGRTVGVVVGAGEMKLRVGGVDVEVDAGEMGFGCDLGFEGAGAGAGAGLGPSVKSSQASNESSSHVGGGGAGLTGCWSFFGAAFATFAGAFAGAVA